MRARFNWSSRPYVRIFTVVHQVSKCSNYILRVVANNAFDIRFQVFNSKIIGKATADPMTRVYDFRIKSKISAALARNHGRISDNLISFTQVNRYLKGVQEEGRAADWFEVFQR